MNITLLFAFRTELTPHIHRDALTSPTLSLEQETLDYDYDAACKLRSSLSNLQYIQVMIKGCEDPWRD